ncbi:MAG TPA: glycerol-3-phosphate cytidylyltransferase [Holosporales bacterium]|nr:glycerol-3-phosphate cytidylyltransferase [Holosporales bacterium]
MISSYIDDYRPMRGQKIVLVGGCFDVMHYGHLRFLKQAKALGDYLIVALESDAALVETKNRKVFHTQEQRAEILEGLRIVDEVLLLPPMASDQAYLELVQRITPSVIAFTRGDPRAHNKEQQAQNVGASCVSIPFEKGFSTTDLLEKYNVST